MGGGEARSCQLFCVFLNELYLTGVWDVSSYDKIVSLSRLGCHALFEENTTYNKACTSGGTFEV